MRTHEETITTPIAAEIERRMAQRGLTQAELCRLAGVGSTYVRDILQGRSLNPKGAQLSKLATALGCTLSDLMGQQIPYDNRPDLPAVEPRVARFRAARWACWESTAEAARLLGVPTQDLDTIEGGGAPLPDALVRMFCLLTGCPVMWIEDGRLAGMPPEMAARVGYFDPDLIPPR